MLALTRVFVGVGEAAYGPAAPTIIADLYPIATRGRVLSLFYMAIPVGKRHRLRVRRNRRQNTGAGACLFTS
jgi:hypothetical protein